MTDRIYYLGTEKNFVIDLAEVQAIFKGQSFVDYTDFNLYLVGGKCLTSSFEAGSFDVEFKQLIHQWEKVKSES